MKPKFGTLKRSTVFFKIYEFDKRNNTNFQHNE